MLDLNISVRLLTILARKLGHDYLLLMADSFSSEEKWCRAIFGQYENYSIELLEANGKEVWLKTTDAEGNIRSNEDMYSELAGLLYKILENGGNVADSKKKLDASMVPGFMIGCVLGGYS